MAPTSEPLGECPAHVEQGPWSSNSRGLYQDTCRAPLALPLTRSPPPWTQWCLSPAGCTGWRAMTRGPRAPTPTQEGPSHLRVVVPQPHRHEVAIHGEQLQRKLVLSHHGVHTVLQVPQVKLHRLAEGLHGCPGTCAVSPGGQDAEQSLPGRLLRRSPHTSITSRLLRWPEMLLEKSLAALGICLSNPPFSAPYLWSCMKSLPV